MKIWITRDDHPALAAALPELAGDHDIVSSPSALDLRDPEQVASYVDGVDAILHTALPTDPAANDEVLLDHAALGAYVVLNAAVKAGVRRAVLISSLSCFDDYPSDYVIDESWRPLPQADASSLAPLLAEWSFREFARQGPMETICLRFGALDEAGGTPTAVAVDAIVRALTVPIDPQSYRWWLFHVVQSSRFPMKAACGRPLQMEVSR